MRNKKIIRGAFLLVLASTCLATVISTPPTEDQIQGAWIGWTTSGNDFYRLILHEKNVGAFASSFCEEPAKLYRINSWKLKKRRLIIDLSMNSTNAYPILLSGTAWPQRIELKVQDPNGGWTNEGILYREEFLEKRFKALKRAMGDD